MDEPLSGVEARQLVRVILRDGSYRFTRHAEERMAERGMTHADCLYVLRRGFVNETLTSFEGSSWRYRFEVPGMAVVVAFRTEESVVVVTTMRTSR